MHTLCSPILSVGIGTQRDEDMGLADEAALLDAFKSCIRSRDLGRGRHVHAYMVITRIKLPVFFLNILTDMYAKCGSLEDACTVFDGMQKRDSVSWNVMISNQTRHGSPKDAIALFRQMELEGLSPDQITFLGLLDACASIRHLRLGAQAHAQLAFSGLELHSMTTNALINMYTKCCDMDLAYKVFNEMDNHNVISWNTILFGYSLQRDAKKVLDGFEKMEHSPVKADAVSYLIVVNACALLGDIELGKNMHAKIKRAGIKPDVVLENALLDMYTKCGDINTALQIFDQMAVRNVVSWTVMIMLHSKQGDIDTAFALFDQMHCEGVIANDATILGILSACCSTGELRKGQQTHAFIIGSDYEAVIHVGNAVVDMYSKLGSLSNARQCFDNMRTRDSVTWNTILSSYAKHGHGKEVLELVQQMRGEGFELDSATLAGILSACSRAGLVVEGVSCITSVQNGDGPILNGSHYACLVDLLARAGLLEMADELYECIRYEPNLTSWRTLLGACKVHGDLQRAKTVANTLLNSQPSNAQVLDTISNMHSFLAGEGLE